MAINLITHTLLQQSKENGSTITTITVSKSTKERLDSLMPKSWTYDVIIDNLCSVWEKEKKNTGKLVKDNQAS